MIKKLYPNGKKKAFNITYDDGVIQDVRFVELMNKYGLKGTFNLNYGLMENSFEWTHNSGMVVRRLTPQQAVQLYGEHEIASHSYTHPFMDNMSEDEIMDEMMKDKMKLEELFGREVVGFAVPFDYYSDLIADCARKCGFEYSRDGNESYSYIPPKNPYYWSAGTYHVKPQFKEFVEDFFKVDEEMALCQIVGHTYDLDVMDMWEYLESVIKRVAENEDIINMTNKDIVRYLGAMDMVVITKMKGNKVSECDKITEHVKMPNSDNVSDGEDEYLIENPSDMDLWFDCDGEIVCVKAGEVWRR